MYTKSKVDTALGTLVGFDNPADPSYAIVSTTNQTSRSGLKFTDNSLVKIKWLRDLTDYANSDDNDFNDYLSNIKKQAINAVITSVFQKPDFIDKQVLYRNANNKVNLIDLPDGFVGFRIRKDATKNIAFEITKDILEFSGTGDITIQLYNSQKSEPIQSETVSITSTLQEVELNWRVDNTDTAYEGEWYYGYLTNGLTVTPFERDYENSNIMSKITHLDMYNIQVDGHNSNTLFDLSLVKGGNQEGWGLNPKITVYEDYTELVIDNDMLFAKAIQLQGQLICLNNYFTTDQINSTDRRVQELRASIEVEISGFDDGTLKRTGLKGILLGEIKRLGREIDKLQNGYMSNGIELITRG